MVPLLKYRQFGLRHLTDIGRSPFGTDPLLAFGVGPHRLIRNMKAPSMTSIFPATTPTFSMTLFTSSSRGLCGDRKTVGAMACCKEFMQWCLAHCLSLAPRPLAGDTARHAWRRRTGSITRHSHWSVLVGIAEVHIGTYACTKGRYYLLARR
jgi:hypothetical protein